MQQIAEKLFLERNKLGLSVYEVADYCGVSYNSLKNWESGKCSPQADKLEKWLEFFGYDLKTVIE